MRTNLLQLTVVVERHDTHTRFEVLGSTVHPPIESEYTIDEAESVAYRILRDYLDTHPQHPHALYLTGLTFNMDEHGDIYDVVPMPVMLIKEHYSDA